MGTRPPASCLLEAKREESMICVWHKNIQYDWIWPLQLAGYKPNTSGIRPYLSLVNYNQFNILIDFKSLEQKAALFE